MNTSVTCHVGGAGTSPRVSVHEQFVAIKVGLTDLTMIVSSSLPATTQAAWLRDLAEQATSLAVIVERREARRLQDEALLTYPEAVA